MAATGTSSYVEYLPRVLWADEPAQPEFSLGSTLRIFEKLLTGINDGIPVEHNGHRHESVAAVIERVHQVFDPWTTPPEFLDWLGSWVALGFPSVWTEYQRRKVLSEIVGIYARRGLRAGLRQFLDLYTVAKTRPRIALDDSSRILFGRLQAGTRAELRTLVSHGPSLRAPGNVAQPLLSHAGPVRPGCLALAPDGGLLLGDHGTPPNVTPTVAAAIWQVSSAGDYRFGGLPPRPQAINVSPAGSWNPIEPVALVVDAPAQPTAGSPWTLWVLDRVASGTSTALYKLAAPNLIASSFSLAATVPLNTLTAIYPVAMVLAPNNRLFIVDRGYWPLQGFKPPRLIEVDVSTGAPAFVASRQLTNVLEPVSATMLASGALLVGDARGQNSITAGDLVSVDPATGVGTRLLSGLTFANNPIVCPHGLWRLGDDRFLVADVGLKPFRSGAGAYAKIAEPAGLFLVSVGGTAPEITPVSETGELVFPIGVVQAGDVTYVADRGDYADPAWAGPLRRVWRLRDSEFGVIVHFSEQRPASKPERSRILTDIRDIVEREMPAHTYWSLVYQL